MSTFYCPLCEAPLKRYARKDQPEQYFWSCTGFAEGCSFSCDDYNEEPFLKTCAECGKILARKLSKKTGRPYVACFNKEEHASKEVVFFNEDGSVRGAEDQPKAKGDFKCPECQGQLLYRRVRKGRFAGQKNVFLCPRKEEHKDGKTHFFEDNDGEPLL